jgi:hypothetical protein
MADVSRQNQVAGSDPLRQARSDEREPSMRAVMLPAGQKAQVLLPFDLSEALTVSEAAAISGRTKVTMRTWAALYHLGRPVGGRWMISRVALAMYLDGDRKALLAYVAGDRECDEVAAYFRRFEVDFEKNSERKS